MYPRLRWTAVVDWSFAVQMDSRHRSRGRPRAGFTLVEIMITITIIGFLAAMAIPAFTLMRQRSQNARLANDLRSFSGAFQTYIMENSDWPADVSPGVVPAEMAGSLSSAWTMPLACGGQWEWDYEPSTPLIAITLYNPTAPLTQMLALDRLIDDGNATTGRFRQNGTEWNFLMED
jgi:prepilin-type N-terminal cleavage/methylation domain-containing protein